MPRLIVLRLHPMEPINGSDFTSYLTDLTITVSDLAMDTPTGVQEVPIGVANYLPIPAGPPGPPSDPPTYDANTDITQHFAVVPPPPLGGGPPTFQFVAVATAVIPVTGAASEYLSSDLRLEVKRGSKTIIKRDLDFNVPTPDEPTPVPADFATRQPVSLHIALPAPPKDADLDLALLDLPTDGTPPPYEDLYNAVRTVLVADPAIPNTDTAVQNKLETLTQEEAKHIAYEIMFNSIVYPPPVPERELAELYTLDYPGRDTTVADQARDMFEAELLRYKAIRSAEAVRATGYVFALAAAFQARRLSEDAVQVGFKFPIHPAAPEADSASKVKEAEVILKN